MGQIHPELLPDRVRCQRHPLSPRGDRSHTQAHAQHRARRLVSHINVLDDRGPPIDPIHRILTARNRHRNHGVRGILHPNGGFLPSLVHVHVFPIRTAGENHPTGGFDRRRHRLVSGLKQHRISRRQLSSFAAVALLAGRIPRAPSSVGDARRNAIHPVGAAQNEFVRRRRRADTPASSIHRHRHQPPGAQLVHRAHTHYGPGADRNDLPNMIQLRHLRQLLRQ